MPKIKVTAKIGDTIHPKYGLLKVGEPYEIEVEEFGDQLFDEPGNKKDLKALNDWRDSLKPKVQETTAPIAVGIKDEGGK